MMVTDFRCWWQNHYVGDFFRYVGDFLNVLNRSPISWIGHQHLELVNNTFGLQHPSPTSMSPASGRKPSESFKIVPPCIIKYFYLLSFSVSSVFIVSPFSDILKSLKSKCLFFRVCFTHSRSCCSESWIRRFQTFFFNSQKGRNGLFLLFRSRNNLSFWLEQNSLYSD